MLRCITALVAALVILGAAAPSAGAWQLAGSPWPSGQISYYTQATGYSARVDRAAAIWNRAGVGVTFVKGSPDTAMVVVKYRGHTCEGEAFTGYTGSRTEVFLAPGCPGGMVVLTAVHEFGHVLGLGHEDGRCARMNSTFDPYTATPGHCGSRGRGWWLRHPLRADDVLGARALYQR